VTHTVGRTFVNILGTPGAEYFHAVTADSITAAASRAPLEQSAISFWNQNLLLVIYPELHNNPRQNIST